MLAGGLGLAAPAKKQKLADGKVRFYDGPPPVDPEGRRRHYECFCSLVRDARLQHHALHERRAVYFSEKVLRDIHSFVTDYQIPGGTQDVDESGASFTEMLSRAKLTNSDVRDEISRWEKEWMGIEVAAWAGARGQGRCGTYHEPSNKPNA